MRGWIAAFPQISEVFDEIEIWATQCCLADHAKVTWVPFRQVKPWPLQALVFRSEVRKRIKSQPSWPPQGVIVQITGFGIPEADIRFIHFSNLLFREEMAKRPHTLKPCWWRLVLLKRSANEERQVLRHGKTGFFWAVSRRLGERLQKMDQSGGKLYLTPNSFDPKRFNFERRRQGRQTAREQYGFKEDEKVLVFSAYAHFERKGLLQAASAVASLREEGLPLRLLVLGGTTATLASFRRKLQVEEISEEGIVFAGLVEEIEKHLAAADALICPSHFEAFSLAEIESAAMGLRLYLTDHYGIEMILDDPTNGRLLPWEVSGMVEVLREDIETGRMGTFHTELGEALNPADYAQRLVAGYRDVLASKESF